MTSKRAKDFLVEQTARQAAIDGVSLSDIEKRMMYFTEGSDAVEDPVTLNDEFERHYNSAEYEDKISHLLKNARVRLQSEDAPQFKTWNEAVAVLREGDHYILVMVGGLPFSRTSSNGASVAAIARISIRVLAPVACLVAVVLAVRRRFGPVPRVHPYVYFGLFVASYLAALWWSRQNKTRPAGRVSRTISKYLFGKW